MFSRLLIHLSNYSITSLLGILASVISFPLLTRIFTVAEYGILNLISFTLLLLVVAGKMGIQHAVIRYSSEIRLGRHKAGVATFNATVVFGMAAVGLAVTLLWAGISQLPPRSWWQDERVPLLFLVTSPLIMIRVLDSAVINLLRAEERSGAYAVYSVLRRFLILGVILLVLFCIARNLWGFYGATIATETLAIAALIWWMQRHVRLHPSLFSLPLFQTMLGFGIPMIGYEVASNILSLGDRYVIQALLGAEPLGVYSAAYNMCDYIQMFLIASVGQAVRPMYIRLWHEKGEEATRHFLDRLMHFYIALSLPVVAGLTAIGADLLAFMASAKYSDGAVIIPWVIGGMILDGATVITAAGLYIQKRPREIALIVMGCGVFNILLNLLLIPLMGLVGAAVSTLASYLALVVLAFLAGRRWLPLKMPWYSLLKFSIIAGAMFFVIERISLPGILMTIACKIVAGTVFFACMTLCCDREIRHTLMTWWQNTGENGGSGCRPPTSE